MRKLYSAEYMFLGSHIYTTIRASLLQLRKPHPYSSSALRVPVAQTIRYHHPTRCLQNRLSHTSTKTAEHVQTQENFKDTSSFTSEERLAKRSSNAITSYQEVHNHKTFSSESFGPSNTKSPALAGYSNSRDECSKQQLDSQKRKDRRRELIAARANKHKMNKFFEIQTNQVSDDWETPFALLDEHSPKRYADPPTIRRYHPWRQPKLRQLRADQIPRPPVWSTHTFCHYIQEITRSSVDHLIERRLYGYGGSHVAEVSKNLVELFKVPAAREFLSPKAFNAAISFFYAHTAIPQAVAFFEYMHWLRMKIPGETMDIMLRSCAMNKDLHNFTKILRICINRGIVPTAGSWTMLVQAVSLRSAREVIIESMRQRGMLKAVQTRREVARLIVRRDIVKHLEHGLDPTSFLDLIDTQYGTGCLSNSVGNIILFEIVLRKPAAEAVGMLQIMMERGMNADEATLNTLLVGCSRERDHLLAIRVLRLLHVEKGVRTDERTFNYLFMQAWRSRLYNFARVIWRTACIQGVATFKIHNLVRSNLLHHKSHVPEDEPVSRARIWSESAGEVIVGIKPLHDLDHILSSNPVTEATPNSTGRQSLIADDLATAGRYRLVDDLTELLTNALKLDREWMESGAWKAKSSEWKRKMAIAVGVTKIAGIPPRISKMKGPSLAR